MPSELKALIRIKKQLTLKEGALYRNTTQVNRRTRLQLVLIQGVMIRLDTLAKIA